MKKKSLKIYIFFYYGECKPLLVKQETALVFATVPQNRLFQKWVLIYFLGPRTPRRLTRRGIEPKGD